MTTRVSYLPTLEVPTLYAGQSATVTWNEVENATLYIVERRFDYDFTDPKVMSWDTFDSMWSKKTWNSFDTQWSSKTWDDFDVQQPSFEIYRGTGTSVEDLISESATFAVYRITAWFGSEIIAVWNTTDHREIIPNRAPVISGQDGDIGTRYQGFSVEFSVVDPDPRNTVYTKCFVDNALRMDIPDTQQGVSYQMVFSDTEIFSYPDGSRHSIRIEATDQKGAISVRNYTFTAVVDFFSTAVFYLLIKDRETGKFYPISKMENDEHLDYMSVGTNTYKVRVVDRYDNFSDTNEVTLTIEVQNGQLALASDPQEMFPLVIKRSNKPVVTMDESAGFTKLLFEGREKPVHVFSGHVERSLNLEFSHTMLEDRVKLSGLIKKGEPFIYRDLYDEKMVGHILSKGISEEGRYTGPNKDAVYDFNLRMEETDYSRRINYD